MGKKHPIALLCCIVIISSKYFLISIGISPLELEVNIREVLKRYMVSILKVLALIIEKHRDTYTNSYIYTHTYAALQVKDYFYNIYDRQNNNNS